MSSEVSQLVLQVQPEDVRGRRRHQADSLPGPGPHSDTIHGNVTIKQSVFRNVGDNIMHNNVIHVSTFNHRKLNLS